MPPEADSEIPAPIRARARAVLQQPVSTRTLVVLAALLVFYLGWNAFWFLCDDAYIAFRYVSNSQLGHGYVWNASPFLPVEGYTSFLWVVLLDAVWTLTGIEPPVSSNWLALAFGAGSVLLTAGILARLNLCDRLGVHRNAITALVLLGLVTNASFLTWSSSGLETSLFNFLILSWVACGCFLRPGSPLWTFGIAAISSLLALTRPDGYLMVATSGVLILWSVWVAERRLRLERLWPALPFALPLLHLLWRRSVYGGWVPNTYIAKVVGAWPESGSRYLASFVLEYGLWWWALLVVGLLVTTLVSRRDADPSFPRAVPSVVIGTIVAHVAYYTFVVGGDHFEYRVYSHLAPLLLLSAAWLVNGLVSRGALEPRGALLALGMVVVVSWPIPWLHHSLGSRLSTRDGTRHLTIPMAPHFPAGLRRYASAYDGLQRWLIVDHSVGKRRREHEVFLRSQRRRYPSRRVLDLPEASGLPVYAVDAVGVAAWSLAGVNVIDTLGLNDRVIAGTPLPEDIPRRMAHGRRPPPGYVGCFDPNVDVEGGRVVLRRRDRPLFADDVRRCEDHYRARQQGLAGAEERGSPQRQAAGARNRELGGSAGRPNS